MLDQKKLSEKSKKDRWIAIQKTGQEMSKTVRSNVCVITGPGRRERENVRSNI